MALRVGQKAPDFKLKDQTGLEHTLSDYKGKAVLVYFYPKDSTPGCTREACSIRDRFQSFGKQGAVVLGISVDSEASHQKFSEKYKLPFSLLADEDKKVVKAYGVWGLKKFMGREYEGTHRNSFLIDANGRIAKIYEKVKPESHAAEVLEDLKAI